MTNQTLTEFLSKIKASLWPHETQFWCTFCICGYWPKIIVHYKLYYKGYSFSVIISSTKKTSVTITVSTIIPLRWGANSVRSKTSYIKGRFSYLIHIHYIWENNTLLTRGFTWEDSIHSLNMGFH
jgi:hypothetical protein